MSGWRDKVSGCDIREGECRGGCSDDIGHIGILDRRASCLDQVLFECKEATGDLGMLGRCKLCQELCLPSSVGAYSGDAVL